MSDEMPTRTTDNQLASNERSRPPSTGPGAGARRFGYLVSIAVNLVILYLANGVPNWDVPFITNDWPDVLWAVNLSLQATIIANLVFLAYDPRWFRHSARILLAALSIIVFYTLYRVFPFDLGRALYDQIARIALLAGMVGVGIALIVEFVGLILGREL